MSQKATRGASAVTDEKEKRKTDSPVKDMKKKMATAEKEKSPTSDKQDKKANAEKPEQKGDKVESKQDKKDKAGDKKETKETAGASKVEKKPETSTKPNRNGHTDQKKENKDVSTNGVDVTNGGVDVTNGKDHVTNGNDVVTNGNAHVTNGNDSKLVSDEDEDLIDDELFPELRYDESDLDVEPADVRSATRRSQVAVTKTPDTPRPASDTNQPPEQALRATQTEDGEAKSKSVKVLKITLSPMEKSEEPETVSQEPETSDTNGNEHRNEIDKEQDGGENRKPDTNFSKSRVKVSPYRRSMRLADQTTSSTTANYTGNNTTMEMDITESSILDPTLDDISVNEDSYIQNMRSIRGRKSYKQLGEMNLSALSSKSAREKRLAAQNASLESRGRPTSVVVGRKRRADEASVETAREATEDVHKRSRIFNRLISFATFNNAVSSPLSEQMIVGVNTDLPMTIPAPDSSKFDPETIKASPDLPTVETPTQQVKMDSKKCIIM